MQLFKTRVYPLGFEDTLLSSTGLLDLKGKKQNGKCVVMIGCGDEVLSLLRQ